MSLDRHQAAAVATQAHRVLLRAGAGAGKTRTLVARVVRLLADDYHPSEILCLTFTRAAAAEMRERVEAELGDDRPWRAQSIEISTFHSWCARTLRTYHDRIGYHRAFTIRDGQDRDDLVRYVGAELRLKWKSPDRLWKEPQVRDRYWRLLREAHAFDYDSLQMALCGLLERDLEVRRQLQARWKHVLCDETQDDAPIQRRLVDLLVADNVFAVGDHAQSIYGFRGAEVQGFLERAQATDWQVLDLPVNYRSLPPIVEAANGLSRAMVVPGLQQEAVRVEAMWEEAVTELVGADREALHEHLADDIGIAAEPADQDPKMTPWSYRDCAILAPTWRLLERASATLTARGIPHRLARRVPDGWNGPEMRWIVQCLRAASNPHDHLAWWAALTAFTPRMRLGEWAGLKAAAARSGKPIGEVLEGGAEGDAQRIVRAVHAAAAVPAELGVDHAVAAILPTLSADLLGLRLTTRAGQGLAAAADLVADWRHARATQAEPVDVAAFLDAWSARELDEPDAEQETPDEVALTTIHGAKGLEWPCVWVLGLEPGVLPRTKDEGPAREEERRLAYVATTRARDRLRMCWSAHRGRSLFIEEALGEQRVAPPAEPAFDTDMPF